MPKFIVRTGAKPGMEIKADSNRTLFGRAEECDVLIADANVSRHHAQAVMLDGMMALVDLNSSNGTFVNGLPISRIFLMDGDVITLGETELVYVDEERVPRDLGMDHSGIMPRLRSADSGSAASPSPQGEENPHTQIFEAIPEETQTDALKEIYQKLKALYRIFQQVADAPNLKEICELVGRAITVSTAAERAVFFLYADKTSDGWQRYYSQTSVRLNHEATQVGEATQLLDRAREEQRVVLAQVDKRGEVDFNEGVANAIAVPLFRGKQLASVIYVDNPQSGDAFSKNDVDFIVTLGVQVSTRLNQFEQVQQLKQENVQLRQTLDQDFVVVTNNEIMKRVMAVTERVAESDATVLITGESGTGKELIAKSIHHFSARRSRPLVAVNCAALPETLLESELFGHEKGSFTGAHERRIGKFEVANHGILFLDELGEISPSAQAKLLRALQEGEIQRVGGTKVIKVDVRVIAATNKKLADEVAKGNFREDLYYRLRVIEIELPPLRKRPDDIPVLAQYFLKQLRGKFPSNVQQISPEAMVALQRYAFPGNVRELRNTIERGLVFATGDTLLPQHLPAEVHAASDGLGGLTTDNLAPACAESPSICSSDNLASQLGDDGEPLTLSELERRHILYVLERVGGNKLKAAGLLGISRTTLYEKLKNYDTPASVAE